MPDATEERPEPVAAEPPAAPTWETWRTEPLPPALESPYPLFLPLPAAGELMPAAERLAEWAALPEMQELRRRCTELPCMLETAERFLKRFADTPDAPHACLLHAQEQETYWLAGDVHGNVEGLLALYSFVCAHARRTGGRHRLVLLGDILDRGEQDLEAAALVQHLLLQENAPAELILVRGNHDMGLACREDGTFYSTVSPAETAERLNAMEDRAAAATLGRAAMLMSRVACCMGEIAGPDVTAPEKCLLFTHGGLPHVDLQEKMFAAAAAAPPQPEADALAVLPPELREPAAKDYTWVRLVDRLPHKIPNRSASGCQMGTEDVNIFRRLHRRLTGRCISFIVRGHDHEDEGFRLYSAQAGLQEHKRLQQHCGVLTLNAMAADEMAPERRTCVLRWRRGESLTLFRMGEEETAAPPAADEPAAQGGGAPPPAAETPETAAHKEPAPPAAAPWYSLKHLFGRDKSSAE